MIYAPGAHTVGVRENYNQLIPECMLKVTVPKATHACKEDQIWSGSKAWIDGSVHGVQSIWYANSTEENWGFLLVNENNTFNEINWIRIWWTVHYSWPSVACLVLNCYRHHYSLVLRNGDGMSNIIHIREGLTQGTHWIWLPMVSKSFCWSNARNRHILTSHSPDRLTILGHWIRLITWGDILFR